MKDIVDGRKVVPFRSHLSFKTISPDNPSALTILAVPPKRSSTVKKSEFFPQFPYSGGSNQPVVVVGEQTPRRNVFAERRKDIEKLNGEFLHPSRGCSDDRLVLVAGARDYVILFLIRVEVG